MKRAHLTVSVFLLAVVLSQSAPAQEPGLSPEGRKLKETWAELQKEPNDPAVQEQYLTAFPHDYKTFLALFDYGRELYENSYIYIDILSVLARSHEKEVGELLVGLSQDARWAGDAPNYLQHATTIYGGRHTQMFATLIKRLPPGKRAHLIAFLADAENFAAYPEYQDIIDHLKILGRVARPLT
jgi:hypothetical protein